MESSTYMDNTSMAILLAMSLPQGWAELPDGILDSIIQRLSCTNDLLAFIATCPTWRVVFMEARASYCKLFPPLLIQSCAQLSNDDGHFGVHHMWQLMGPANPSIRFHRPVPSNIPPDMEFVVYSYGHAIFADLSVSKMGGRFTMVDMFTGVQVSAPPCPDLVEWSPFNSIDLLCCTLTAPISSPKAFLLVSTIDFYGLRVWRVGSDDGWEYIRTEYGGMGCIDHIVVFGDRIIVLDCDLSLYTMHLDDPKLVMHTIKPLLIVEEDNTDEMVSKDALENPQLMVCGDTLALVASSGLDFDSLVYFYLRDLDDSPEGRTLWWSSVPTTDLNCEVFISGAYGRLVFYDGWCGRWAVSRANPERWGGRRGHVAYADYSDELFPFDSGVMLPSWVTPDVLSLDG